MISTTVNLSSTPVAIINVAEIDYDVFIMGGNGGGTLFMGGPSLNASNPATYTEVFDLGGGVTNYSQKVRVRTGESFVVAGNGQCSFFCTPMAGAKGFIDFDSITFTATSPNEDSPPVTGIIESFGWNSGTLLVTVTASSWSDPDYPPVFSLLPVDNSGNVSQVAIQGQDGVSDPLGVSSGFTGAFVAAQVSLTCLQYGLFVTLANIGDTVTYSAQLIGSGVEASRG